MAQESQALRQRNVLPEGSFLDGEISALEIYQSAR